MYINLCSILSLFFLVHVPILHSSPCSPSPCGINAVCKELGGTGSCTCLPEYFGDPYTYCRPECLMNNDCPFNRVCLNRKCTDPCPGSCGVNTECRVINHVPICSCFAGYVGDAQIQCHLKLSKIYSSAQLTLLPNAYYPQLLKNLDEILASHRRVAHIQHAKSFRADLFAPVHRDTLEHHQHVDLNA